jgi:hypothetical protein
MMAFGGWLGVMWLDTQRPYSYDQKLSFVSPDPAPQHSMVVVDWKFAEPPSRLCPGTLQRTLWDARTGEKLITYDTTPAAMTVSKGDTHLARAFMLPPMKLPPEVTYQGDVCFQCNLLQTILPRLFCIKTPTLNFRVE